MESLELNKKTSDQISKTGPRDVFMQLLAIIALYVGVISFGSLLFGIVNIFFPDQLSFESARFAKNSMRWQLSILVVLFPVYVWLTSFLQKEITLNPAKRELKTRKWLLYFTLFIASIVIAGDLISLVYRFLNGELTIRFLLKVLIVLFLALSVFMYYGWNLKKEITASKHPKMKLFVKGVLVFAGAVIIFGFFIAGSPKAERMTRFDEKRTENLQSIQSSIISYWQDKNALPQNLEDLRDDIRGYIPPKDPETEGAYQYRVTGDLSFELCADFNLSSKDSKYSSGEFYPYKVPYGLESNWEHGVGKTCFERTIDPDRFPPRK